MNVQQIRRIVRRSAVVIVLMVVVGAASAFAVTRVIHKQYQSVGTVNVIAPSQQTNAAALGLQATQIIDTTAALMTQPPLLAHVASQVRVPPGTDLSKEVTAIPYLDTSLITVTVTDPDPNRAAKIANTLMSDFAADVKSQNSAQIKTDTSQLALLQSTLETQIADDQAALASARANHSDTTSLQTQLANDQNDLATVTSQYDTLISSEEQGQETVTVVTLASVNGLPVSPSLRLNLSLGAFAGLLVGIGVAVLMQYLDQGLRNEEDVRRHLGLPTFAVIPSYSAADVQAHNRRAMAAGEAFRRLRTSIMFASLEHPALSLVITSARAGEGKTRTSANLAGVIAAADARSAHRRRYAPTQHAQAVPRADSARHVGIAHARCHQRDAARTGKALMAAFNQTDHPNLSLLTAGTIPPNPAELLASRAARDTLRWLEHQFDMVIIDTPPVEAVTDATALAADASATVLVVDGRSTDARRLRATVDRLTGLGATVIGIVLNKSRQLPNEGDYYYYYDSADDGSAPAAPAAAGAAPVTDRGGTWVPVA